MAWFRVCPASWTSSLSSPVVSKSIYPGLPFVLSVLLLVYPMPFLALGAVAKLTAFPPTRDTQAFGAPFMVDFHPSVWLNLSFPEKEKVKALVFSEGIFFYQLLSYAHNARG